MINIVCDETFSAAQLIQFITSPLRQYPNHKLLDRINEASEINDIFAQLQHVQGKQ